MNAHEQAGRAGGQIRHTVQRADTADAAATALVTDSNKVSYAAIVANLDIATAKFVVAAFTGSAAMLAEGIHSAVDTGNELLPSKRWDS